MRSVKTKKEIRDRRDVGVFFCRSLRIAFLEGWPMRYKGLKQGNIWCPSMDTKYLSICLTRS